MNRQSSETPLTRRGVLKATGILSAGGAIGIASRTASATDSSTQDLREGEHPNVSESKSLEASPAFPLQFTESWSLAPPPSFPQQHVEQWSLAPPPSFPQQHVEQWTEGPPIEAVNGTVPTDPDDDGLYEDFNGDGDLNFPDVNVFFQHSDQPEITDYTSYYDFTGDGRITLQDVMKLFTSV